MRKKVAVCFFGLPRCTHVTLPHILEYVIRPLEIKYEVNVFSVLNLQKSVLSERSKENHEISYSNYHFFESHRHLFLKPNDYFDKSLFDRLLILGDSWRDEGLSLKFHLMQLYTIEKVYRLARDEFDPDFYVFIRPDLFIHDKLPLVRFIEKKYNSNFVLIPGWQWWNGVNDRFCLVSKFSASTFAERYTRLCNRASTQPVHSESDLELYLKKDNVKVLTFNSHMSRVRAGGVIELEDFNVFSSTYSWRRRLKARIYNIEVYKRIKGLAEFIRHPILFMKFEN